MCNISDFQKLCWVGGGASAKVFKVRHKRYGYIRALKELNAYIKDEDDPAYITFLKEARLLLNIGNGGHPNIVRIGHPFLDNNRAYLEMDYVQGDTVQKLTESSPFIPFEEIHRFILDIVGAVAYCHHDIYLDLMDKEKDQLETDPDDARQFIIGKQKRLALINKYRVIHNDLHSANIIRRDRDGRYILLDFGLSIQNNECVQSSSRRDGAIEYKAPEKLSPNAYIVPKEFETATDVYSLGVLLYEMMTGRPPFPLMGKSEKDISEVMTAHLENTPPYIEPLRRKAFEMTHPGEKYQQDYPDWFIGFIMKCLSKKPTDRYADAKEMLDEYNNLLTETPHVTGKRETNHAGGIKKGNQPGDDANTADHRPNKREDASKKTNPRTGGNASMADSAAHESWLSQYVPYIIAALIGISAMLGINTFFP